MSGLPRLSSIDSTRDLMQDPYRFISARARSLKSDVFEARLLLTRTICMTGKDAAQIFSDEQLFKRKGAVTGPLTATLFGKGGVQGLDDEAHLHRKKLFMSFVTPDNVLQLKSIMKDWLEVYTVRWMHESQIVMYEELQEILARTVCAWAGVPLPESDIKKRTRELTAIFDSAESGKKYFLSRPSRKSAEGWITDLVKEVRAGKHQELEGSPLYVITHFRDMDGKLLNPHIAAVEILNLLKPTVALSLYFVFSLHALHLHPESRQRLKAQETGFLDNFVNEVRRFYPFFPALHAKVRQDFKWGRLQFKKGTRVMLDIYGINHDSRIWERPNEFNPDRFKKWSMSPFDFIPQGVGDHMMDHRCPGELFTIELMRTFVEYFVMNISYEVPPQDLQVQMNRLPAMPKSHMILRELRKQVPFLELNA